MRVPSFSSGFSTSVELPSLKPRVTIIGRTKLPWGTQTTPSLACSSLPASGEGFFSLPFFLPVWRNSGTTWSSWGVQRNAALGTMRTSWRSPIINVTFAVRYGISFPPELSVSTSTV